mgnify:CR=1 FL=1
MCVYVSLCPSASNYSHPKFREDMGKTRKSKWLNYMYSWMQNNVEFNLVLKKDQFSNKLGGWSFGDLTNVIYVLGFDMALWIGLVSTTGSWSC